MPRKPPAIQTSCQILTAMTNDNANCKKTRLWPLSWRCALHFGIVWHVISTFTSNLMPPKPQTIQTFATPQPYTELSTRHRIISCELDGFHMSQEICIENNPLMIQTFPKPKCHSSPLSRGFPRDLVMTPLTVAPTSAGGFPSLRSPSSLHILGRVIWDQCFLLPNDCLSRLWLCQAWSRSAKLKLKKMASRQNRHRHRYRNHKMATSQGSWRQLPQHHRVHRWDAMNARVF